MGKEKKKENHRRSADCAWWQFTFFYSLFTRHMPYTINACYHLNKLIWYEMSDVFNRLLLSMQVRNNSFCSQKEENYRLTKILNMLRNLENSNVVSMLDAPESDLIVPITRTNEVILVWVEIKWHNRCRVPSECPDWIALLQKSIPRNNYRIQLKSSKTQTHYITYSQHFLLRKQCYGPWQDTTANSGRLLLSFQFHTKN